MRVLLRYTLAPAPKWAAESFFPARPWLPPWLHFRPNLATPPAVMAAAAASVASQAQAVLRGRLCDPGFVHSGLRSSPDTNYRWAKSIPPIRRTPPPRGKQLFANPPGFGLGSKLKYLVSSSVSEACNNSVLLLGPRGCGKAAVRVFTLVVPFPCPTFLVLLNCGAGFRWNVPVEGKLRFRFSAGGRHGCWGSEEGAPWCHFRGMAATVFYLVHLSKESCAMLFCKLQMMICLKLRKTSVAISSVSKVQWCRPACCTYVTITFPSRSSDNITNFLAWKDGLIKEL